jgi:hypothetical protein
MMIQHLLNPPYDSTIKVVYLYFDYQNHINQTVERVMSCLLYQIACSLPKLPSSLKESHQKSISGGSNPNLLELIELFKVCAKEYPSVLVVLDAFDECDLRQQGRMVSIIHQLCSVGIRVFITTRPHILPDLEQFKDAKLMEIKANEDDIENYLTRELQNRPRLSDSFKREVIKKIKSKARAMYGKFLNWLTR